MLLEIKTKANQSMYDLVLMTYGTLDKIVKLCDDNGIDNVNVIPGTGVTLVYDGTLVVDQQITGLNLTTAAIAPIAIAAFVSSFNYILDFTL